LKQHGYGRAESRRFQQGQLFHQQLTAIDLVFQAFGFKRNGSKKMPEIDVLATRRMSARSMPRSCYTRPGSVMVSLRRVEEVVCRSGAKANPRDGLVGGIAQARMVPHAGVEPALLSELDFESSASTNSANGA
jgi:hypothetical protein